MRYVPVRFTPMTWFHISSVDSCVCAARRIPAAFTSTSRPPSCSTTPATAALHRGFVGHVERAGGETLGDAVGLGQLLGLRSRPSAATSTACTVPASASRRSTVARPMPDAPPVTMMRRSWNRSIGRRLLVVVVAPDRGGRAAAGTGSRSARARASARARRTPEVWCRRRRPAPAAPPRCTPRACGARTGRTGTSGRRSPT